LSNTCLCPKPPGGTVRCSDDQLAVCGYRDGQIVSGCFDRPSHVRATEDESVKNLFLSNWILTVITGSDRSEYQPIQDDELALLQTGRYGSSETVNLLKFSVPRDLDLGNIAKFMVAGS
jgi:hypothetical protein